MDSRSGFVIFLGIIFVLSSAILIFNSSVLNPRENYVPNRPGYLEINNKTMVCKYYYICFLREDGEWHKPRYNAGTNLILASNINVSNESKIKQFFSRNNINIVINTTPTQSIENSELILRVTPFSHYLGYYYNTIKKQNKTITAYLLSQYNFTEPAIVILGPGLGAKENSIEFDGDNIVVQGQTKEELSLNLGKLLLIAVS